VRWRGPAGRYLAILLQLRDQDHDVTVVERNPAGRTYGWGVVFWDDLLQALQDSDPVTADDISRHAFRWVDQVVHVQGRQTAHLGGVRLQHEPSAPARPARPGGRSTSASVSSSNARSRSRRSWPAPT
jgi:2-polyprenyl-6-methoxyphenol hydroxylase-like FAD-dependent oxidoreductase